MWWVDPLDAALAYQDELSESGTCIEGQTSRCLACCSKFYTVMYIGHMAGSLLINIINLDRIGFSASATARTRHAQRPRVPRAVGKTPRST